MKEILVLDRYLIAIHEQLQHQYVISAIQDTFSSRRQHERAEYQTETCELILLHELSEIQTLF